MRRFCWLSCAAALALCLVTPLAQADTAGGGSAEEFAQQTAEHVLTVAGNSAEANIVEAIQCIGVIEQFREQGHPYLARLIAHSCIAMIDARSRESVYYVYEVCVYSIQILLQQGRPDLAYAVGQVCEHAITTVIVSRELAVAAILDALGE